MKNKYIWILFSLMFLAGCESLEDTYADYTGDGAIRYLGSCENVQITPAWERFIVTWENSVDPIIDKVKVTWSGNNVYRDTLLERNTDSISLPASGNGSYEVTVCNIDKKGNTSLVSKLYGRPYTNTHEEVLSFTRLISKHYFVNKGENNRLVLFFSGWQTYVTRASLKYYDQNGGLQTYQLDSATVEKKFILINQNIDPSKPVTLEREGRVEGCPDLIVFDPYELSHEKLYSAELKSWVKARYGIDDLAAFADTCQVLEIDYSLRSFADLLNFSKLQKLVLGKNRYLKERDITRPGASSELLEVDESIFSMNVAHEWSNLEAIERYNQHYFPKNNTPDWVTEKGNLTPPVLNLPDPFDWTITCEQAEAASESPLKLLFDQDPQTTWEPGEVTAPRSFDIKVDMGTVQPIAGVRVTQMIFFAYQAFKKDMLPESIKIKVSKDGIDWKDATWVPENKLGTMSEEVTDIYFSTIQEVRYVKFTLYDRSFRSGYTIALAGIDIFAPLQ